MIAESAAYGDRSPWFTTLIAKSENLPAVRDELRRYNVVETRTLDIAQGAKKSRVVAWTFLPIGRGVSPRRPALCDASRRASR